MRAHVDDIAAADHEVGIFSREHAIEVRPVVASDKPHFKEGFARLSRQSRYFRFLSNKNRLTDTDLRYLTAVDGQNHYAICAFKRHPNGREEGVGVARFVRLTDRPDTAEVAITVIDAWQKRGVGALLYERLVAAARERGVRVLRSEVHENNHGIQKLLSTVAPTTVVMRDGNVIALELEIA